MGFIRWRRAKRFNKIIQTKNNLYLSNHIADEILPLLDKNFRGKNISVQPGKRHRHRKRRSREKHGLKPIVNVNKNLFFYLLDRKIHIFLIIDQNGAN